MIAAVGAFLTTVRQAQERAAASESRAKAEADLRQKTEEIASLNRQLADLVTGGTAFCYLSLAVRDGEDGFLVAAVNAGKTPVYDVAARVVDLAEFTALPSGGKLPALFNPKLQFPVGNLGIQQSLIVGRLDLGSGNAKDYNVFFSARNGFVTQLLRCRRTADGWRVATRVMRTGEKTEVLYEQVDDGFPKGPNGEIPW
jgi:hypothetical protein